MEIMWAFASSLVLIAQRASAILLRVVLVILFLLLNRASLGQ